jgi:2-pyrone-4,6-dicarboxylate lactonase
MPPVDHTAQGEAIEFRAPPSACDAHFHVFGRAARYPYAADLRYGLPFAPLPAYLALARRLGIERMVFVQPSAYGRDNSCMLDAMAHLSDRQCRGIVDIEEHAPEKTIAQMHALGVRGIRINVSPVKPPQAGFAEALLARIERLDALCAETGWQLDFLLPGWLTAELMGTLQRLRCSFTLAHMGMFLAREGVAQPGFRQLLELLRHGEGRCWIKLTGVYRISQTPGFADVAPMARALIDSAPDRMIWGSDYPHLSYADKVSSVELFNLLGRWAPQDELRRKILVDNPRALFGF